MDRLSTSQAATELGVTRQRVVAMIAAGRLKAEKFGRDWMIERKAIAAVKGRKAGRPSGKAKKK